jgi:hypothetical protein
MVAMVVLPLVHTPPVVEVLSMVVVPLHISALPAIEATAGYTVMVLVL